MALAGPGANLLLAVIAAVALRGGEIAGVFYAPDSIRFGDIAGSDAGVLWLSLGRLLSVFFSMNLLLMVFNLLPFPPLDGSAAITLLMDRGTTTKYQEFIWSTPILGVVGLFAAWQMFDYVFRPFFIIAVNLVFSGANYG
jgi:Zn-dependent protease